MTRLTLLAVGSLLLLVAGACTNVAGLTGYEFVEASTDGTSAEAGSDAALCTTTFTGVAVSASCRACLEKNDCCDAANVCLSSAACIGKFKAGCGGDVACKALTTCAKGKCECP